MLDIFQEARRLVTARQVAEHYGLHPSRSGFVCCPLHHEKTGSLKLYDDGHWHCFGCNRGGSSIDLVAALYDLTPLEAVRRLNADAHNIAVVMIHHLRKMRDDGDPFNMISGTTGISGAADSMWVLVKEKRGDDTATLNITGRDVEMQEFVLKLEQSEITPFSEG